jgi:hypothetical protein
VNGLTCIVASQVLPSLGSSPVRKAAQVVAATVLIAALRLAVGSGSLPAEVAKAALDALAAAGC